jgi:hypothetical protein
MPKRMLTVATVLAALALVAGESEAQQPAAGSQAAPAGAGAPSPEDARRKLNEDRARKRAEDKQRAAEQQRKQQEALEKANAEKQQSEAQEAQKRAAQERARDRKREQQERQEQCVIKPRGARRLGSGEVPGGDPAERHCGPERDPGTRVGAAHDRERIIPRGV